MRKICLNLYQIPTKIVTEICFTKPFMCTKSKLDPSMHLHFMAKFASVQKEEDKIIKLNFGHSYLGIGWVDFLQIWCVASPTWHSSLLQIWLQSDKRPLT